MSRSRFTVELDVDDDALRAHDGDEPDLAKLERERDPMPTDAAFYGSLAVLLEGNVRGLVREWNGSLR